MAFVARVLAAVTVLVIPSVFPARRLTGCWPASIFLAPLITTLGAAMAVTIAVELRTPAWPWTFAMFLLSNVAALVWCRPARDGWDVEPLSIMLVLGIAALPLLMLLRPVAGADARAIWLLHARWVFAGGAFYRDAINNPAFAFSHTDYPPALPSAVGLVWVVTRGVDLWIGVICVTVLNVSTVGFLGITLVRVAGGARWTRAAIGSFIVICAYLFAGIYAIDGYADLLTASSAALSVVYLLVLPASEESIIIGMVCAAMSGLAKNDGLPLELFVLALCVIRHRHFLRRVLPASAVTATVLLAWPILGRTWGAHNDVIAGGNLRRMLGGNRTVWGRLGPTLSAMGNRNQVTVALAAIMMLVVGLRFLQLTRRSLGLGSAGWTWVAITTSFLLLTSVYVINPAPLAWLVSTSLDRTTIMIRLLLATDAAVWLALLPGQGARRKPQARPTGASSRPHPAVNVSLLPDTLGAVRDVISLTLAQAVRVERRR